MLYAESSSGRSHRSITASAKVLDPSNTAHALSSHQEAQKRAIEEARLRAEAEKQQDELSTPVASSSNLSAPVSLSVSRTTSPARCSASRIQQVKTMVICALLDSKSFVICKINYSKYISLIGNEARA